MPPRTTPTTRTGREQAAARSRAEENRRRQRNGIIAVVVALVLVLVAVGVAVALSQRGGTDSGAGAVATTSAASVDFREVIATIPAERFDAAGAPETAAAGLFAMPEGEVRVTDGLPTVTYVGAEFCPYCAGERWALVAALSRFGTFTGLEASSSADDEGDIPTVTFVDATYSSDVLAFEAYETADRDGAALQTLPDDIATLMRTYDAPPYARQVGGIPWTWLGTYQTIGSGVPLRDFFPDGGTVAGVTHDDVAAAMAAGSDGVGSDILAASNVITAQLCTLTEGAPDDVCTSPGVTAAATRLPG